MRSASPRDLALPVARVRGLLPLDISPSDGGKRHAQTPRGWVEWQRPRDSGEDRHGGSASPQARATSHSRTAPEGSQSQSRKATVPPGPPMTEQEAWLKRALEVLALADAAPGPVELAIAHSLDVLGAAAPTLLPQAALLQAVILHLEPSMFTSLPAAPRRSLLPTQTLGEMPYRYKGSLPYFTLARKQRARVEELHMFMDHLRETTAKTDKIHAINAARMAVGSSAIGISNTRKEFSNIRACHPALIWAMGFWKVYAENRRTSRKKAEMLEMSAVGELIRPFRHFQIFTTERKIQSQEITQQAFILERQMLEVTIKHLEEEKEDLRAEFGACNATLERLRKRLTEQTQKCAALAERIEQAKPERVKLVLCSVMDFVSAAVLQDAQLERTAAHRHLKSRDLSSLLANEEDGIDKLIRSDGFLSRWLNYHLVQVKGVAVDILKTVARARNEKLVRLEGRASGENSSADVETHYNRCRLVRATQRINKIGVDLKDGAILSILYASLASPAAGFDPALLWPLDETNLEVRAERIADAFKTILPTRASQNLLHASDIAPGNPQILTMLLSALFLHQPKIPPIVLTTQAQRPPRAVREQASQLASAAEKAASGCAYEVLQDMARLIQVGEVPKDLAQMEVDELLVRWVNRHLENKENYQPITTLVELKGGRLFYDLLLRIAPDVVKVLPETKLLAEARSPTERKKRMVEFVVHCMQRCTSFAILTAETVKEGPVDLLAAGLAGLFLCRPALNVLPKSQLQKHLDLIGQVARCFEKVPDGMFTNSCAAFINGLPAFSEAVTCVRAARELNEVLEKRVHTYLVDILAQRAHGTPCEVRGTIPEQASSKPHEALRPLFLAPDRIRSVLMVELLRKDQEEGPVTSTDQPELLLTDCLRKNRALFKEMFKYYASPAADGSTAEAPGAIKQETHRRSILPLKRHSVFGSAKGHTEKDSESGTILVDLRSLTRIYKDCQIRSLKLTAADVEEIYNEVLSRCNSNTSKTKKSVDGLRFEPFIEATLVMGCRIEVGDIPALDFTKKFLYLIDKHFWPLATRRNDDLLYRVTYDPGVGSILRRYGVILRLLFQKYATLHRGETKGITTMTFSDLLAMFRHANLLDIKLTEKMLLSIVHGLQRLQAGAAAKAPGPEEGGDTGQSDQTGESQAVDEPFAFQEFIDIIIAAVLFREPNPFILFEIRFERLLLHGLFQPLQDYWLDRPPWANLGKILQESLSRSDIQVRSGYLRTRPRGGSQTTTSQEKKEVEVEAAEVPSKVLESGPESGPVAVGRIGRKRGGVLHPDMKP